MKNFLSFRDIFLEAEKHIIELMKKNSYPRFIQSDYYRNLLQNAPNPVPKKTFVLFFFVPTKDRISSVFRGILHFVKDNYFRTSSTSSDEYDSDDSGHKGENGNATANAISKVQPLGAPLATTAAVATAVAAANAASAQSAANEIQK